MINIKLHNCSIATIGGIIEVEKKLQTQFPKSYKDFLMRYNGGITEENVFNEEINVGITKFIPIESIYQLTSEIEYFPANSFVIAESHGGNYVYMDGKTHAIYFLDHEIEGPNFLISSNFIEFLSMLKPFTIESLNLPSPKVISSWVDPNFVPEFD